MAHNRWALPALVDFSAVRVRRSNEPPRFFSPVPGLLGLGSAYDHQQDRCVWNANPATVLRIDPLRLGRHLRLRLASPNAEAAMAHSPRRLFDGRWRIRAFFHGTEDVYAVELGCCPATRAAHDNNALDRPAGRETSLEAWHRHLADLHR